MDPFAPMDTMIDPFADLAALDLDLNAIGAGLELQVGPPWPPEISKPPRPKVAEVLEAAQQEKEDHEIRLRILEHTHLVLTGQIVGHFERHKDLVRNGEIELAPLTDLRDETDLANTSICQMQIIYEDPYRNVINQDEARAKEDFCHYNLEYWKRAHARMFGGNLDMALTDDIQKGMVVVFAGISPDNHETGIDTRLVDPATVFPIFDDELCELYRVYTVTASKLIGTYRKLGPSFEKKVKKLARKKGTRYNPNTELNVTEYWDRNWFLLAVDDEHVITVEHKYTKVPFKVHYSCFARSGHTERTNYSHGQTSEILEGFGGQRVLVGGNNSGTRALSIAEMAYPFLGRRFAAHDIEEAVAGLALTKYRRSYRPPQMVTQDLLAADEGVPQVDYSEGGVTPLSEGEKLEPILDPLDPQVSAIVQGFTTQNKMTGMSPGVAYGQSPGSQTTGSALNVLSSNGLDRFVPIASIKEEVLAEVAEWWLELERDWGPILGPVGNRGTITVPRRNPRQGLSPAHEVTPEMLERVGVRMNVSLKRFDPNQAGTIANGLMILKSMQGISKRKVIELSGFTDDVDGELEAIERELLQEVPEVMQLRNLDLVAAQASEAEALGDVDEADRLWKLFDYLTEEIAMSRQAKDLSRMEMGMPPMGAGMMPPGMQPPGMAPGMGGGDPNRLPGTMPPPPPLMLGPGGQSPVMAQGQSLPGYGMPPGVQGGRPAGPPPGPPLVPPGFGD